MKECFSIVLSCLVAAAAQAESLYTTNFAGTAAQSPTSTILTLTSVNLVSNNQSVGVISTNYGASLLLPNVQMNQTGAGHTPDWTATFTFTANEATTLSLESLTLSVMWATMNGSHQDNSNQMNASTVATLTYGGSSYNTKTITFTRPAADYGNVSSVSVTDSLSFDSPVTLKLDKGSTFSISVSPTYTGSYGNSLGIKTLEVNGSATPMQTIPEPAAATFSLLALAALAARRRRK